LLFTQIFNLEIYTKYSFKYEIITAADISLEATATQMAAAATTTVETAAATVMTQIASAAVQNQTALTPEWQA
jgi:hypothetical protein